MPASCEQTALRTQSSSPSFLLLAPRELQTPSVSPPLLEDDPNILLREAAYEGNCKDTVQALHKGAQIHDASIFNETALHAACSSPIAHRGHLATARFLLNRGARIHGSLDTEDHSPLDRACQQGNKVALVHLLLQHSLPHPEHTSLSSLAKTLLEKHAKALETQPQLRALLISFS